jgi:ABC-type lipoprotein release transport system permease subunit
MNRRTLIWRSLRHRWRSHLGVLLGAAVGSAALIGALVVGDSVRGSLREQALQRLGWVDAAIAPGDRFFTAPLAAAIDEAGHPAVTRRVAAALRLPATATRQDGAARANQVNLFGVQTNFWPAGLAGEFAGLPRRSVLLNESLAAQLNARAGDGLVFRVHKPSTLSREVPITPQSDASVALRLTVHRVLRADEMGNFSLQSGQAPPFNAFVRQEDLDMPAGLKGRVNLMLVEGAGDGPGSKAWPELDRLVAAHARLADYALDLRILTNPPAVELHTERIFLEPSIVAAAASAMAGDGSTSAARVHLTYMVNQIRAGDRLVPYSMVTAADEPLVPAAMKDDEMLVNQWLADRLQVKAGDMIELAYFLPESGASLVERTNRFRVHGVVPIEGGHADRTLMPEFPGLAKAESTQEWDAGFPLVHKLGDEDEDYWKKYRGTPKAFVRLAAGQAMWTNRFGNATAVRRPLPPDENGPRLAARVERELLGKLNPLQFGLNVEPVRAQALAASAQSQDFGGLFLGFSFFLILAALILMALLFQFGLEQRTAEVGTLLALGFRPGQVRQLFLGEGAVLALAGGIVGVAGGLGYAHVMLQGLTTIWRDAIGASSLHFFVTPVTLAIGLGSSVVVATLSIWLVLRKQARRPARELLAEGASHELNELAGPVRRKRGGLACWSALGAGLAGVSLIGWALAGGRRASPEIFFGAGSLLLIAGLAGTALLLRRLEVGRGRGPRLTLTLSALGWRGVTRRRKRSLASVALLACGSFLIVAVGANRLEADRDAAERSSGTGGFALFGESTLPVVRDLNSSSGREFYGLPEAQLAGVEIVPFRVHAGDEASCLNLNRAQRPRLVGVKPELLAGRKAFTFAGTVDGVARERPWLSLKAGEFYPAKGTPLGPDEVAAIGDAASIQWALGKKLGDTLDYVDGLGRPFKVRLVGGVANSILQGMLVIDDAEFVKRFPGEAGHRMFLVDVPSNQPPTNVVATLTRALQDVGLELTPCARRLAAFNAVQNTYLNTFQILGGLGLLLGSAGLGVVVLRNVLERRGELGLLQAVGFRQRLLRRLLLCEHGGLLALGLSVGMVAALAAVLPVLLAPGATMRPTALAATLLGVLASGLLWTWLATRFALRGRLLDALRDE